MCWFPLVPRGSGLRRHGSRASGLAASLLLFSAASLLLKAASLSSASLWRSFSSISLSRSLLLPFYFCKLLLSFYLFFQFRPPFQVQVFFLL
eukprot:UN05848